MGLEHWLKELVERGGSDLYLVEGVPPTIRVGGALLRLPLEVLRGEDIEAEVLPVLPGHAAQDYRAHGYADCSHRSARGRFRINLHHERGRPAAAIRALPERPPRFSGLGLPAAVEGLTRLPYGLVLIGGPTGSGKTTTVAALVEEINRRSARHIITIEDPIEYEHSHQNSLLEQVEIGIDAASFPEALRSAVRSSPDIIVVGEMRDPETMQIALAAAQTGHLVFSTVHTRDIPSTVSRFADAFPAERQAWIRQELSIAAAAIMTQVLLPRIGGGRVPAAELLVCGHGARQHIRKNTLQHLHQEMMTTRPHGSFTFEESLSQLVKAGAIERAEAQRVAPNPEELEILLRPV